MEAYQERVIAEKKDLDEKANKLYKFLLADSFDELDEIDKDLLSDQYDAMTEYRIILGKRIERFK